MAARSNNTIIAKCIDVIQNANARNENMHHVRNHKRAASESNTKLMKHIKQLESSENRILTRFEDLCIELQFDIFEYMNLIKLFRAFWNLNSTINAILKDVRLHVSIELSCSSKNDLNYFRSIVRPQLPVERLTRVHLNRVNLLSIVKVDELKHIRWLKLDDFKWNDLLLVPWSNLQNSCVSLKMATCDESITIDDHGELVHKLLYLESLRICRLEFRWTMPHKNPLFIHAPISKITNLTLARSFCCTSLLIQYLNHLPYLRFLTITLDEWSSSYCNRTCDNHVLLPHLKKLELSFNRGPREKLEQIIHAFKIPKLESFIMYGKGEKYFWGYDDNDYWSELLDRLPSSVKRIVVDLKQKFTKLNDTVLVYHVQQQLMNPRRASIITDIESPYDLLLSPRERQNY